MNQSSGSLHTIHWKELCPWLILVRATRVAFMVRVLLLALVGVALTEAGWLLIESYVWETAGSGFFRLPDFSLPEATSAGVSENSGPLVNGWRWAIQPLTRLADVSTYYHTAGYGVAGLWTIVVWGLFGGAIARIAALYLTRNELIGPLASLNSAAKRWRSTVAAPAMTFIGLMVMAIPLVLLGWASQVSWINEVMNLLLLVPLIIGLGFTVATVGLLLGWPLMWSTISVEHTDAFDAVSRSYAYVFQRPLHLLFYVCVATLLGILAHFVLATGLDLGIEASTRLMGLGGGEELLAQLKSLGAGDDFSSQMRFFWKRAFLGVARAFPMAFLWPTAVAIYLLLRREIDSAEMDQVAIEESKDMLQPES